MVLAGGTDVYPAKAARAGWGDMRHTDVLDISAAARACAASPRRRPRWRIGALTTWTELIARRAAAAVRRPEAGGARGRRRADPEPRHARRQPLHRLAGGRRRCPTCWRWMPAIELASRQGRRVVPMRDFIDGYRQTACRADEIVTAILVPKPRAAGAQPFPQARRAQLSGDLHRHGGGRRSRRTRTDASRPRGSRSAPARRCRSACRRWRPRWSVSPSARRPTWSRREHVAHLAPIDDIRGSADYRRQAALALTRDLLARSGAARQQRRAA